LQVITVSREGVAKLLGALEKKADLIGSHQYW